MQEDGQAVNIAVSLAVGLILGNAVYAESIFDCTVLMATVPIPLASFCAKLLASSAYPVAVVEILGIVG